MGELLAEYERVTNRLRCPICDKGDWCLIARDRSTAVCARICEGSECAVGDAGYKHIIDLDARVSPVYTPRAPRREEPRRDFTQTMASLRMDATSDVLSASADMLGVCVESLRALGTGYHQLAGALAFPMRDELGVCGVRLRRVSDGFKYAMLGSRNGVFMPNLLRVGGVWVIVEGPTDAAAAISMGFTNVIGRPFCRGGNRIIAQILQGYHPSCVIIVADSDAVGVSGAEQLANELCDLYDVRVIEPLDGAKDMRAWLRLDATKNDVLKVADFSPEWRPQ